MIEVTRRKRTWQEAIRAIFGGTKADNRERLHGLVQERGGRKSCDKPKACGMCCLSLQMDDNAAIRAEKNCDECDEPCLTIREYMRLGL